MQLPRKGVPDTRPNRCEWIVVQSLIMLGATKQKKEEKKVYPLSLLLNLWPQKSIFRKNNNLWHKITVMIGRNYYLHPDFSARSFILPKIHYTLQIFATIFNILLCQSLIQHIFYYVQYMNSTISNFQPYSNTL